MGTPQENMISWVIESVRVYNYITPQHVARRFRVGEQDAQEVVVRASAQQPKIKYNKASKRWEWSD